MWLLSVSCCFVAGVVLAISGHPVPLLYAATGGVFWLCLAREWRRRGLIVLLLCIACTFLGAWQYEHTASPSSDIMVSQFDAQSNVTLSGRVVDDPDVDGPYQLFVIDDIILGAGESSQPVEGKIRATVRYAGPLHYGDVVTLEGTLEAPRNFSEFDYVAYLEQQGVHSTMFCPRVASVESPKETGLLHAVHTLNGTLKTSLDHALPQPQSSLAQTLLLGRRDSLPGEVRTNFADAGAAHMLAVSGLHLAIVTAAVLAIALALLGRWRYLYVWIALAAVVLYVLLTGLRPPVVRAGIMAAVFLLAELAGRQKHGATALGFAAACMVALEPGILLQTSFQLSFMAMTGLIVLYRPLRQSFETALHRANPDSDSPAALLAPCLDIVAATIAATMMTLPIVARVFGQVPVLIVPVSVLALPILPFAIAGAAITALVGMHSVAAAVVFGWATWLPLTYLLDLTRLAAQQSWATISIGSPPAYVEFVYYATVISLAVIWNRRSRRTEDAPHQEQATNSHLSRLWYSVPPLLVAVVLVWSVVAAAPDGRLHVTFLDVGQGDACLIETPGGHTIAVDGGRDGVVMSQHLGAALPFWDRSIDIVVDTHQHEDHLAGLLPIIRNYDVGLALCPDHEEDSSLKSEWTRLLAEGDIPMHVGHASQEIDLGDGTSLQVVGPPEVSTYSDCDDNSVVLRVCYGDVVFLLTGDISSRAEQDLCHYMTDMDCTVLKVAHHGSNTSSCAQFVQAVTPELAVVSVGVDNEYGHPAPDVVERLQESGATVLTTADYGSIECVTDGTTVQVTATEA